VIDAAAGVLCVDPGLAHVGWAFVRRFGPGGSGKLDLIDSGHIPTEPDEELDRRLRKIWRVLACAVRDYRPAIVGVENQRNANIAARMNARQIAEAQRNGTAIPKAMGFGANNDAVFEVVGLVKALTWAKPERSLLLYLPQQAKIAVLGKGNGSADKKQVRQAVRHYFPGYEQLQQRELDLNEADAIAGAIYVERVTLLQSRRAG
jgi:Holliday junction resolvasome RuvABC endonuclease subunit